MDQYRIPLPNGRSLTVPVDQLRRIARGLGDHFDERQRDGQDPPIVQALRALPAEQRTEALSVVLLRFGSKQDVETIANELQLSPWQVWQLEEAFQSALSEVQESRQHVVSRAALRTIDHEHRGGSPEELLASALGDDHNPSGGPRLALQLPRRTQQ